MVAAAALVLEDMTVPAGALAIGVPAVIRADAGLRQQPWIRYAVQTYLDLAERHRTGLRRLDGLALPARAPRSNRGGGGPGEEVGPRRRTRERRCPHDPATVRCLPGHAGNHSPCAPGGKRRFLDVRSYRFGSRDSAETFRPGYRPPSAAGICSSGRPHDGAGTGSGRNVVPAGLSWRWMTSAAPWMVAIPYAIVGLSSVSTTML